MRESREESKSGYKKVEHTDYTRPNIVHFEALNEGVTEKLSCEIMDTYADAKDIPVQAITELHEKVSRPYDVYVAIVDRFIEIIGTAKDMRSDEVWQEIVKGYIEGQDIIRHPLVRWLNKVCGKDLIDKLGQVNAYRSDAGEFLEFLQMKILPFIKNKKFARIVKIKGEV